MGTKIKAVICPDCSGSGMWECDEHGNEYSNPIKCESCNGSGARIELKEGYQPLYSINRAMNYKKAIQ